MSRGLALLVFAVCASLIGLIVFEFASSNTDDAAAAKAVPPTPNRPESRPAPAKVSDLVATGLAAPLFSPTRQPPEQSSEPANDLGNVRLSGILIEPARRMAIFVAGAKPFILTEGETFDSWRLDSITPLAISLSGPDGSRTLEPKPDKSLVRPPPPVVANRLMSSPNAARPAFAPPVLSANGMPPIAKMPPPGRPVRSFQDNAARSP